MCVRNEFVAGGWNRAPERRCEEGHMREDPVVIRGIWK